MDRITIDPITRIEGHMKIDAVVDGGEVKEVQTCGTMFRGFELILKGRHPLDATILTQRVCGVCPICHATASALALDNALGIDGSIPDNGRILRNIILAANYIQSHILHFYALCALDYVDVTAAADYAGDDSDLKSIARFIARGELAPFVPRFEGDYRFSKEMNAELARHYVQALRARKLAHEMLALFGGRAPHNCGIVAGGVTSQPSVDKMSTLLGNVQELLEFIEDVYIPDVIAVAKKYSDYLEIGKGCCNLLSYGVFDLDTAETNLLKRARLLNQGNYQGDGLNEVDAAKIAEHVKHSWYDDSCAGHPSQTQTQPAPGKEGAYSWLKSPRYDGKVTEVGPLARIYCSYLAGNEKVKPAVDDLLSAVGVGADAVFSVMGRHAARALETKVVADAVREWATELKPGEPACAEFKIPDEAEGVGLTGAPRGALGHWVRIKGGRIDGYQLVVPTTWNASPKDGDGNPGPMEQAILGTKIKDAENPFEIVRIARSFDPCLACSVHVMTPRGTELGEFRIA